jgi:Na+/H+-dicarboxylate symporter
MKGITIAIILAATLATAVGIFGAQLVQPVHALEAAASAASVSGSAQVNCAFATDDIIAVACEGLATP